MCRRMAAVLCSLVLSGGVHAQVFKSGVSLVTVDVTVLDRDGKPVPGLNADDFVIKLNGKAQPIRALSWVSVPADVPSSPAHTPTRDVGARRVVSNAGPGEDSRIVVIAVDDLSFPASGGKRTLAAAREFVERASPNLLLGLMTTSGVTVVNPTADHAAVADAIARVVGAFNDPRRARLPNGPTLGIAESIDIVDNNDRGTLEQVLTRECQEAGRTNGQGAGLYAVAISAFNAKCAEDAQTSARLVAAAARGNTDRQIAALLTALSRMQRAPGLKQMLLLSEGIGATRNLHSTIDPVGRAAAAAGVQLDIVMEDEETIDLGDSGHSMTEVAGQVMTDTGLSNRLRADKAMFRASLETLADVSGGTFEMAVADAAPALARATTAGSAVYRIGVEAPADAAATKPMQVSAAVNRPGLVAHANRHAIFPVARTSSSHRVDKDQVVAAIDEGVLSFDVPLEVAVTRRRATGGQVELAIGMAVPASVKGPVTTAFALIDRTGVGHKGSRSLPRTAVDGSFRLTFPVQVAAGGYILRVAVQDADGAVGSIETAINATLPSLGALDVSDALTWWVDDGGNAQFLSLDEVPSGVTRLGAGLEIYPRSGDALPADLKVRLSLVPVGDARPIAVAVVRPRVGDRMVRAEALLPIDDAPAGDYTLRIDVAAGGLIIGDATACIRIQRK